jgi:tetrahydromethanopterin S-methyltransferase subunit G|tara:strand:- start:226 stop:465 length:240 start_codon:yes stop_codon:yes gene_type:complete
MATVDKEIALMQQRMDQVDKKLDKMDEKLDNLVKELLHPDNGVTARVNKNTAARKVLVKAIWVLYGIVAAAIAKIFISS